MTNITFLVGSFYPDFEAVGYCAYQVQKCLAHEFLISVVSFRNGTDQSTEQSIDGIQIFRIETEDMKRRGLAMYRSGRLMKAQVTMLRLRGAMRRLLSPTTINRSLVEAYLERLERLDPRPDVLVPVVFPFESVLAAQAYKVATPHVTLVPYLFDDFVDSGSLHVLRIARALKRSRHIRLEHRMLAEADAVLAMHPLRRHLERNFDSTLLRKVRYLEHPLLSPPTGAAEERKDGVVRLCFTGSLIKKVREPSYLVSVLSALRLETPVLADFFVMGNAAHAVPSGVLSNGLKIVNHGRVTKPEADAAVARADILINIGEVTGRQVSSKVFEYISTGKPILHLAAAEKDAVTEILSKYPRALCIRAQQSKLQENAIKISGLITSGIGRNLTFEQVKTIYPEALPSATADIFRDIVKEFSEGRVAER